MNPVLWLYRGLGPANHRLKAALAHFGSPEAVWQRGREDGFFTARERARLFSRDPADEPPFSRRALCWGGEDYPARLSALPAPPGFLLCEGDPAVLAGPAVTVAGSRTPDAYGADCARAFGRALAQGGAAVVAGVAYGVDQAALEGALSAGGRAVAVLPAGFGHLTPAGFRDLCERIARAGGAVVSEHPDDCPVTRQAYHQRARLLAALGDRLFVPQCAQKSGAHLAAAAARALQKPVYALPGDVRTPFAAGFWRLLQEGGQVCVYPHQLLDQPQGEPATPPPPPREVPAGPAGAILALLHSGPAPLEGILAGVQAPPPAVLAALSKLELAGQIARGVDGRYRRVL